LVLQTYDCAGMILGAERHRPNETQDQRPRDLQQRSMQSRGGWQTLMKWIVRYLAVRCIAWLGDS
jgi:hypothetical protein